MHLDRRGLHKYGRVGSMYDRLLKPYACDAKSLHWAKHRTEPYWINVTRSGKSDQVLTTTDENECLLCREEKIWNESPIVYEEMQSV
jgi:hypothetical protein